MPNRIQINGLDIEAPDGASISVVNGKVTINGVEQGSVGDGKIVISTNASFSLHCDKDVEVKGDVRNGVKAGGNVTAHNITGGIEAGGNVTAFNVTGGIEAKGDVKVSGNVVGGIEARTFSK